MDRSIADAFIADLKALGWSVIDSTDFPEASLAMDDERHHIHFKVFDGALSVSCMSFSCGASSADDLSDAESVSIVASAEPWRSTLRIIDRHLTEAGR